MSLTMGDHTNSTHVTAADNHGKISNFKFYEVSNLASLDLQHHCIMSRNLGIRVANSAAIMCD